MRTPITLLALVAAIPAAAQTAGSETMFRTPPAPAASPAPAPDIGTASLDRFARARDNLVALREGRLSVSALSPQELQDVIDFESALRGAVPDNRSPRQQCIDDEVRRAGGKPTPLAWQVIRLKCG